MSDQQNWNGIGKQLRDAVQGALVTGDFKEMNQIERIQYYEKILDEAKFAIRKLDEALENYLNLQEEIKELEDYYDSPLWMKDYRDDEEGKLPYDLKRGVLSEDGVYNVLADHGRLQDFIAKNVCAEYNEKDGVSDKDIGES